MMSIDKIESLKRQMLALEKIRESFQTIEKSLTADDAEKVWLNSAIIDITDAIRALKFAVAP